MSLRECKPTWNGILGAYGEDVRLNAYEEDGLIHVKVDGNDIFCGTIGDSQVTFIALSKLYGARRSKALMKMRCEGETLTRHE